MTVSFQEVTNYGNLSLAATYAALGRSRLRSVREFNDDKINMLLCLQDDLRSGKYKTSVYHNRVLTDRGKDRVISSLPFYPDRIVHWAYMIYLEPQLLARYSPRSHASIPDRGIHAALYQTRNVLLHRPEESQYCLKLDIRKCFQNVDHAVLKKLLRRLDIDDEFYKHLCELVDSFNPGIPIGNYPSQWFTNFYLTEIDKWIEKQGFLHIRYMDDIVIFGRSSEELHKLRIDLFTFIASACKMQVKNTWQVFPVSRGIDFVGYRIYTNRVLLRKSTFKRFRRVLLRMNRRVLATGNLTERDKNVLGSYAGWVSYCTPNVKRTLYARYIAPILSASDVDRRYRTKITKLVEV